MTDVAAESPRLDTSVDDGITWIVATNPLRMNAFTAAMWKAIPEAIAAAERDPAVRVIVLRGSGRKAFSAGADISEFETARTGSNARDYDAMNDAAFTALSNATKPVIAMIHGFCLGGGLGIAACADIRLSDEVAQFAIPAAKLGIGYNARWLRTLLAVASAPHVKELLFTGRRFPAADALAMGLVNRVVPTDELESTARALAVEIAQNAPLTIRAAKAAIDALSRQPECADTRLLDNLVEDCFRSEDYAEGRRAFLEKRSPRFMGR